MVLIPIRKLSGEYNEETVANEHAYVWRWATHTGYINWCSIWQLKKVNVLLFGYRCRSMAVLFASTFTCVKLHKKVLIKWDVVIFQENLLSFWWLHALKWKLSNKHPSLNLNTSLGIIWCETCCYHMWWFSYFLRAWFFCKQNLHLQSKEKRVKNLQCVHHLGTFRWAYFINH